jgi:hypothetical protein
MDDLRRVEITVDKVRDLVLPAAADYPSTRGRGDGTCCDGCGDGIDIQEEALAVCVGGVLILVFHEVCYGAWRGFTAA